MKRIVFLNDEYLPIEEARVSINDRGFIFGDSVYDVVPVVRGVPIDFGIHISRLQASADEIAIKLPEVFFKHKLRQITHELLRLNNPLADYKLYIQISRGVTERSHVSYEETQPTVLVMLQHFTRPARVQGGIVGSLLEDYRWKFRHIKSTSILANVIAKMTAAHNGASEAILYDVKPGVNIVTEGSSSNIFIVDRDHRLITHPEDNAILSGATRARVLKIAAEQGMPVSERTFTTEELLNANEVFATSSGIFICGIYKVDEILINSGEIGTVTRKLEKLFNEYVDEQVSIKSETKIRAENNAKTDT